MPHGIVSFKSQQAHTLKPTDLPKATTGTRDVGGAKPNFLKALGHAIAKPFQALARALTPAQTHAPASANAARNARVEQAIDDFIEARKASNGNTKDPALNAARKELRAAMFEELTATPLYQAAENAGPGAFNTKDVFESESPAKALTDGIERLTRGDCMEKFKASGLSVAEGVAIYTYTRGAYVAINAEVRQGKAAESDLMREMRETIESGLDKLPPYSKQEGGAPPAVYRLAKLPDSIDARYQAGNIVSDPGIMSTTSNDQFNFKGMEEQTHCLSIKPKENTKGRDVSWMAERPGENEIIFPPGTQMKVLKRDMDQVPTGSTVGRTPEQMVGILLVEV